MPGGMQAQIAIVGSGPAGFYTAEALLRAGLDCRIGLYERLPAPYGLVRYGVAPDHPKLKSVTAVFDRIAADPRIRYLGGVEVGRDVTLAELEANHHAVILACGSPIGRQLGVAGEGLDGVMSSSTFVGWYNAHPDDAVVLPPLGHPAAAVVGIGNVAMDVCRLLCMDVRALAGHDAAPAALAALAGSRVREVHLIARGAPGTAKCTVKELRELGTLPGLAVRFAQDAAVLAAGEPTELMAEWRALAARPDPPQVERTLHVHFFSVPVAFEGDGRLAALRLRDASSAPPMERTIQCGLAVTCIGYRGQPPAGAPFDDTGGVVPNTAGRVCDARGGPRVGLYVVGWLKRGPTGVIGTNRADAVETAATVVADLSASPIVARAGTAAIETLLRERAVRPIDFAGWQRLDRWERERGRACGAARVKVSGLGEAHAVLAAELSAPA
jgi:ferredoxin--NADP+ reductase